MRLEQLTTEGPRYLSIVGENLPPRPLYLALSEPLNYFSGRAFHLYCAKPQAAHTSALLRYCYVTKPDFFSLTSHKPKPWRRKLLKAESLLNVKYFLISSTRQRNLYLLTEQISALFRQLNNSNDIRLNSPKSENFFSCMLEKFYRNIKVCSENPTSFWLIDVLNQKPKSELVNAVRSLEEELKISIVEECEVIAIPREYYTISPNRKVRALFDEDVSWFSNDG